MTKMLKLTMLCAFIISLMACENRKTGMVEENATNGSEKSVAKAAADKVNAAKKFADFSFEETEFDFGEISQGDVVKHSFKFTNTGEAPLMISDIKTTCGCTTPQYTKDPVAPGESGEILVQFNSAGKSGVVNKRVTIYANVEGGTDLVSIKCLINTDKNVAGPFKQQPAS